LLESSRQGKTSRRLAGWAAILAVPIAIAGIYGMNFANMPELERRYGYSAVLGVIVAVCTYLFVRLRRASWI
jgi:magnesium transporter